MPRTKLTATKSVELPAVKESAKDKPAAVPVDKSTAEPTVKESAKVKKIPVKAEAVLKPVEMVQYQIRKIPMTRRFLMGICNSVYDPLGIATPYTI